MPRIIHVTTVPLSLRFLEGQPAYMAARGYDVQVVSSPGRMLDDFIRKEGTKGHAIPMSRRIEPSVDAISLARLVRLFRRERPDIVHAHTPKGGLLGTAAAAITGVPVRVYHMRGLPLVTATGRKRLLLATSERAACALSTATICVSPSLRSRALALRLSSPERLRVLASGSGNGVDAMGRFRRRGLGKAKRAALGLPLEAPVVGFVGRISRDKGIPDLARAWAWLRERTPDAHLILVGPEEQNDPVPASCLSALRADPRVRILGFTEDIAELYEAFDVVVLPTYREGFPNVLLEAAAMELPVVATEADGCVDAVVDGVTGALVPVGETEALARAIEAYLARPELRREHGAAARKRVEARFDRERIWAELEATYRELLDAHRFEGSR